MSYMRWDKGHNWYIYGCDSYPGSKGAASGLVINPSKTEIHIHSHEEIYALWQALGYWLEDESYKE